MGPRIPRSKEIGHTVRGIGGTLDPRGMRESEFLSLEPRGIRGPEVQSFINFRRGRLQGHQREEATRDIGFSRTYLPSPWVLPPQLTDTTAEANPRTECLTPAAVRRSTTVLPYFEIPFSLVWASPCPNVRVIGRRYAEELRDRPRCALNRSPYLTRLPILQIVTGGGKAPEF